MINDQYKIKIKYRNLSHKVFINCPIVRISKSTCRGCNRHAYVSDDMEYLTNYKRCEQCYRNTFYTYDIPQRANKLVYTKKCEEAFAFDDVSEKDALKILAFWEKHLIGFSYECICKCPKCCKYAIDLVTKNMIEEEGKCNICAKTTKVLLYQPPLNTNTDKKKSETQKRKRKTKQKRKQPQQKQKTNKRRRK